jgi:YD repeat-containing protein
MRDGISRRQWLLGLFTGLGGACRRQLSPGAPAGAAEAPPPPKAVSTVRTDADPLGQVTTSTYDAANRLCAVQDPAHLVSATMVYEAWPARGRSPG